MTGFLPAILCTLGWTHLSRVPQVSSLLCDPEMVCRCRKCQQAVAGWSKAQCETFSTCLVSTSIFHPNPMVRLRIQTDHNCTLILSVCQSAFLQNGYAVRSPEALPHAHLPIFLVEEEEKVLVWTVVVLLLPSVEKGVR